MALLSFRGRVLAVVALTVLASACSSGGTLSTDTTQSGDAAATSVPTESTLPSTSTTAVAEPSGADEDVVECDVKALRAALNSKMKMDLCTTSWAVGNTDRDTWNCPKAGCRQISLFHLDGAWKKTVVCDSTQPLTYWKGSCYREDMTSVQATDIPPPSIQCKIWPANTDFNFLTVTGCKATKEVIAAATTGACTHWSQNFILPLVKCDSGTGIRLAQGVLKKAGYSVQVDGYFGPSTAKAVFDFQKKQGIEQTGMIDLPTWQKLFPNNSGLRGKDTNNDGTITPDEL